MTVSRRRPAGDDARRRPTSADVARASGVSRATVSYVLNNVAGQTIPESTRERVREVARELGYVPNAMAQALKRGTSRVILLDLYGWPWGPASDRFMAAFDAELASAGFLLLVRHGIGAAVDIEDVAVQVAAHTVVSRREFDAGAVEAMGNAGVRVAASQFFQGAQRDLLLVQLGYLRERGHTQLLYALPDEPSLAELARIRLAAAKEAARALGVDLHATVTLTADPVRNRDDLAAALTASPGVTAMAAYNDDVALAALAACARLGIAVPDRLAVIGLDNTRAGAQAMPTLTTVDMDLDTIGRFAARRLIAPPDAPPAESLPRATVVARESA
ncbi:MAG: LacI family DNA-binding transcriptional regulator [Mycobacteriaceae bacterium]|nr:LacI family DNA-binding transcriptional regulator [Mycobacteriaceae bacterium]